MINKNQITYLFGAGASFHAIPTIDKLNDRIENLIKYLTDKKETAENQDSNLLVDSNIKENINILITLIDELEWLNFESENHQTVDTLAKKFYVQQDDNSLCRLKRALMIYFFFEQNIPFPNYSEIKNEHELLLDKRYDNLIASIAEREKSRVRFKENIKIITWNYDLQIDFAVKNYFKGKSTTINKIKNENNIHPNHSSYNNGLENILDKFAVLKLNGNAFLDNTFKNSNYDGETINDYKFQKNNISDNYILGKFLLEYKNIFLKGINSNHEVYKYFNFAWEKEEKYIGHNSLISQAMKIMEATKILIIVGYSFPYFNSEIDKQLFTKCFPKEIIIQDLEPEKIKERLLFLFNQNDDTYKNIKISCQRPEKYFPIHPET